MLTLNAEEQWFYFKLLPDDPVSKVAGPLVNTPVKGGEWTVGSEDGWMDKPHYCDFLY